MLTLIAIYKLLHWLFTLPLKTKSAAVPHWTERDGKGQFVDTVILGLLSEGCAFSSRDREMGLDQILLY